MEVKINKLDKSGSMSVSFDEEWMNQLREEAQCTRTNMRAIIERRLLGESENDSDSVPMSPTFVFMWVSYPQVFRSFLINQFRTIGKPVRILYIANMAVNAYKGDKETWDEQIRDCDIVIGQNVRNDFVDIFTQMINLLHAYGIVSHTPYGKIVPPKGKRLDEFVENDVDFGEWWDECYGRANDDKPAEDDSASSDDGDDFDL